MNNRLLRWSLLACLALLFIACQPIRPLATARQPVSTLSTYTDDRKFDVFVGEVHAALAGIFARLE